MKRCAACLFIGRARVKRTAFDLKLAGGFRADDLSVAQPAEPRTEDFSGPAVTGYAGSKNGNRGAWCTLAHAAREMAHVARMAVKAAGRPRPASRTLCGFFTHDPLTLLSTILSKIALTLENRNDNFLPAAARKHHSPRAAYSRCGWGPV
jgi:hypothetical protein